MPTNQSPDSNPPRSVETKSASPTPTAKPAPVKPAPVKRAPAKQAKQAQKKSRDELIAENAYYRAERRGFAPGYEHEDWLAAEMEVDTPKKRAGARRKEPLG